MLAYGSTRNTSHERLTEYYVNTVEHTCMKRVSVKLDEARVNELDEIASDDGVSRSEVIRTLLDDALNTHDDEVNKLREKIDELETELERVHREKRQILEQREENTELVKYVEEERSLSRQKAQAGIATRAKWWLFGMES
jgi:Arc/MetJ-type ribon-helix-helix transcriptional regulator